MFLIGGRCRKLKVLASEFLITSTGKGSISKLTIPGHLYSTLLAEAARYVSFTCSGFERRPGADQILTPTKFFCVCLSLLTAVIRFWATVCKTVRRMLSDRCPLFPVCL